MERKIQAWRIHIPDRHLQRTFSEIAVRSRSNEKSTMEENKHGEGGNPTRIFLQGCVFFLSCPLRRLPFILPLLSSHVLSCHWAFSCFSSLLLSRACPPLHYHWVSVMSSTWITLFSAWRVVASSMPRGKGRTRQDKTNTSQSQSQHNTTQQKTKTRQAQNGTTTTQKIKKTRRQDFLK